MPPSPSRLCHAYALLALALAGACVEEDLASSTRASDLTGTDIVTSGSVRPAPVPLGFAFEQFNWDGRLSFNSSGGRSLVATPVRPSGIQIDPSAVPVFAQQPVTGSPVAMSDPAGQLSALAPNETFSHFSVSQDPTVDGPNPYRCTANTVAGGIAAPGDHDCYRLRVYIVTLVNDDNSKKMYQFPAVVVVRAYDSTAATAPRIARAGAVPITTHQITKFQMTGPIRAVRYRDGSALVQHAGRFELTSTADARLVLSRRTAVEYTFNFTPGAPPDGWSKPRFLTDMHADPACVDPRTGATVDVAPPAACPSGKLRLGEIYPLARQPIRDALGATCTEAGPDTGCTMIYPWIAQDGSELFYARVRQFSAVPGVLIQRAGLGVVGPRTSFMQKYIDGPNNRCRLFTGNLASSPGLVPSMWSTWRELGQDRGFPFLRGREVYPIFSRGGYSEVDFTDSSDASYLAFFRMNEVLEQRDAAANQEQATCRDVGDEHRCFEQRVSHSLTPDTSGHFNTGRLEALDGGAQGKAVFPGEYQTYADGDTTVRSKRADWFCDDEHGGDENPGFVGRAVYFPPTGLVRVPTHPDQGPGSKFASADPAALTLARAEGITIEAAVRLLDGRVGTLPILTKGALLSVRLVADGAAWRVAVSVRAQASSPYLTVKSPPIGRADVLAWTHVAATLKPDGGSLAVTVRVQAGTKTLSASGRLALGAIPDDGADLLIGPGVALFQSEIGVTTPRAIALIDEVGISRGIRGVDFLARAAYARLAVTNVVRGSDLGDQLAAAGLTPPVGLAPEDMRIPNDVRVLIDEGRFPAAVALGQQIFTDTTLTEQATPIACATCHAPRKALVDARPGPTSRGVAGDTGLNAPTLLNRAFSIRQFFDTRSTDLVDQAMDPIVNPLEMNGTAAGVVAHVKRVRAAAFAALAQCTGGTTCFDDQRLVSLALASFQLTQMWGGQVVDLVARGDRAGALALVGNDASRLDSFARGKAVFEGKARCASCHVGATFTDELLHNTGLSATGDPSRGGRTKTPTLRAVRLTAPYFHDGSAADLDAVLTHYVNGALEPGAIGARDLELRPIQLDGAERADLKVFLESL